jgi:hypothetical protein
VLALVVVASYECTMRARWSWWHTACSTVYSIGGLAGVNCAGSNQRRDAAAVAGKCLAVWRLRYLNKDGEGSSGERKCTCLRWLRLLVMSVQCVHAGFFGGIRRVEKCTASEVWRVSIVQAAIIAEAQQQQQRGSVWLSDGRVTSTSE